MINVFNLIVSKLNELVVDDHKQTAKKYLNIPFNTALLESSCSVKNTTTTRRGPRRCLSARSIRSRPDNHVDDEHIDDLFKGEV